MSSSCRLSVLDLSWNTLGEKGAIIFANALPLNSSLVELNLASNSIGDSGGQRIMKSLKQHSSLALFNISQNEIADGTCFVAAQVCTVVAFVECDLVVQSCAVLVLRR